MLRLLPLLMLAVASSAAAQGLDLDQLSFTPIATGLTGPTSITHAGDGSGRLYITEQSGLVRVWQNGSLLPTPFLDVSANISCCAELGLLSIAFHPNFPTDPRFFVAYTDPEWRITVSQGQSTDGLTATGALLGMLSIAKPAPNHNGGQLHFGPDGMLYISAGDGGNGGDPFNFAQTLTLLLGKILRIDVDSGAPYAIPPDNPFVGLLQEKPEIWHYGLRNPWRFSFDRATGEMFIGDVGQGAVEEIDVAPAGVGGLNFGWRRMEGSDCYNPAMNCSDSTLTLPILEYRHEGGGRSVTGGYVYRGSAIPMLDGYYFYADWLTTELFVAAKTAGVWTLMDTRVTGSQITSFGEDEAGEIYFTDSAGSAYKITGAALSPCPSVTATPLNFSLSSASQPAAVTVQTPDPDCSWTASATADWVSLGTAGPVSGSGELQITVTASPEAVARMATVTINGSEVHITQDPGVTCAPMPGNSARYFDAAAHPAQTQSVQIPPVCGWTAAAPAGWVSITAGSEQTGSGNVTFDVAANATDAQRETTIDFSDGVQLPIVQRGTLTQFADLDASHFAFDGANKLRARGITDGCASSPLRFCVGDSVTRGQIAVFIVRAVLGSDTFDFPSEPYFDDVPATHPFFKWVQKFRELGYTDGCGPAQFCVNAPATREEIAVFLVRLRLGPSAEFTYPPAAVFGDVGPSSPFFRWIQKLSELRITSGCAAGTYCPANNVTRGEMALFIIRAAFSELLP